MHVLLALAMFDVLAMPRSSGRLDFGSRLRSLRSTLDLHTFCRSARGGAATRHGPDGRNGADGASSGLLVLAARRTPSLLFRRLWRCVWLLNNWRVLYIWLSTVLSCVQRLVNVCGVNGHVFELYRSFFAIVMPLLRKIRKMLHN